ncbi:MexH family multidrug efflux RND transporter periplasmic adaptor subunit [Marivirga tractuosa]|uniref:Efflux transporter, RND family, MFP subunit n=1 Tax=Marivirga tractuosa (strain ATCC 23168 / DSM 4126 / NBRC 15989 / NCIMB 1408 / VKM B-1430 / H-43) TaxID=643867 RepID=E4TSS3_MARTH|nr:efflux RND transporter periplasmic adaptor subunit [Marivirga tractuosa]ADR21883.1 efflux transporter, RND family, MFP subunit [Marivirga tractuosa DSM 4126]BDD13659.1 MexH family multidrug efflux RND transporter periplasmic adaptor subunit [Marivirga tractuosa]
MNKIIIRIIASVAVLAIIIYLIFPNIFSSEEKSKIETPATGGSTKIAIDAQIVKYETFENDIVLTGSLLANESVQLASEISGKIDDIYFKEGEFVKEGKLLVQTNVADLEANLQRLKYTAKLNAQTEQRQKQLLEKEAISREEYDIAFTNLKTTQAEIDALQAEIDKSRIRAPFSGYIGLRYVSEGSYITPTSQIASLYNVDPIKIEFSVPSRYSGLVKKGSKITFSSEAENKDRNANVYAIEPQIDPVTRTLTARAETPNPSNELIPGQFIRINLSLENRENAILIPTTAIMPKANGHTVFIIKEGRAHLKDVELGARTSNRVEILKGISKGDTVAIAGVPQLKDRAEVDIKKLEK